MLIQSVICFSHVSADERNGVPIAAHVRVLLDAYKYQRQGGLKVGFASDYVTVNSLIMQANSYWLYIVPWGINKASLKIFLYLVSVTISFHHVSFHIVPNNSLKSMHVVFEFRL